MIETTVGIASSTLVLTSVGWIPASSLHIGDTVYNASGETVVVLDSKAMIGTDTRLVRTGHGRLIIIGVDQKVNAFRAGISCGVVPDTLIKDYGHSYAPWHIRTDPLACLAAYSNTTAYVSSQPKFPFRDYVMDVSKLSDPIGLITLTVESDDGVVLVGKSMLPVVFKTEKSNDGQR